MPNRTNTDPMLGAIGWIALTVVVVVAVAIVSAVSDTEEAAETGTVKQRQDLIDQLIEEEP